MEFSQAAVDLIKEFEGFKAKPYVFPAGKHTIGYGHVLIQPIKADKRVTELEALVMLRNDLAIFSLFTRQVVKLTITQGQHDALCSLIYNWGGYEFSKSKGLMLLNKGKFNDAATEFFSKEKGVVNIGKAFSNGLYRRRQAELALWNKR